MKRKTIKRSKKKTVLPKKLRGMMLAAVMAFIGIGAYAETVSISTYYPSPYGSYQNLDTTTMSNTGGAALASSSGNVVIGAASTTEKFHVVGARSLLNTTMVGEVQSGFSMIEDRGNTGLALLSTGALANGIVILENGGVGVGQTTVTANRRMEINGNTQINGRLYLCDDGSPQDCGLMKVDCSGGNCWPVYS